MLEDRLDDVVEVGDDPAPVDERLASSMPSGLGSPSLAGSGRGLLRGRCGDRELFRAPSGVCRSSARGRSAGAWSPSRIFVGDGVEGQQALRPRPVRSTTMPVCTSASSIIERASLSVVRRLSCRRDRVGHRLGQRAPRPGGRRAAIQPSGRLASIDDQEVARAGRRARGRAPRPRSSPGRPWSPASGRRPRRAAATAA